MYEFEDEILDLTEIFSAGLTPVLESLLDVNDIDADFELEF